MHIPSVDTDIGLKTTQIEERYTQEKDAIWGWNDDSASEAEGEEENGREAGTDRIGDYIQNVLAGEVLARGDGDEHG